jgi:hypothetical protein
VPSLARPARLLRVAGVAALGLTLGAGATLAVRGLRGPDRPAASVRRLDLPGTAPAAGAAATRPPAAPVAAGTARAAVRRFRAAAARGDAATSWALLDRAGQARYRSRARWQRAQADRLAVSGVRVGGERPAGGGAVDVTVEATHPAGVDPFVGLTPGRTVETWRARHQRDGWRVAADPVRSRALLPSDRGAPAAVSAWVGRLLGCDPRGAAALQAGDLYGPASLAAAPCAERGRWTVAAARGFDAATDPQPYVAAFGPEVAGWARLVPVQGPHTRFSAVVAPVGDAWRVLGTDPMQASR